MKLLAIFLIVISFATAGYAQETPAWEVFAGYSLQKSNVREYFRSTPIIYSTRNQYVNLSGWEASVTENMNHWFGGTLDVSGHYATPQFRGVASRQRMYSILYGPRVSFRVHGFVPFVHLLAGASRADVRVKPVGPHLSDLSFAVAPGAGLDVNVMTRTAVRFQIAYLHANALGGKENNFRASLGVVYRPGRVR